MAKLSNGLGRCESNATLPEAGPLQKERQEASGPK